MVLIFGWNIIRIRTSGRRDKRVSLTEHKKAVKKMQTFSKGDSGKVEKISTIAE